ncbi:hypothetical protein [Pseudomonas sp. CCC3.1]|uniref:hypothetical protein n=1 Tax=Pseudomonas sp. CCC3.1 TaxID=3048607 RepID=UPI002AC8C9C5|nr:hypothetical protein [Pseudomonas sp. CCC3.1]MEB0207133.1 hypothetical protein [Pseudomonas sp. CCC3.1]WPX34857.1 hypothetical protein RHM56_16315 [Pseudomonas sp. CCC3.1]
MRARLFAIALLALPLAAQAQTTAHEIESTCATQSKVAADIMKRRLDGEPIESLLAVFRQAENFPGSFRTRVREAYQVEVGSEAEREGKIEAFSKKHYLECKAHEVSKPARPSYTIEDWLQNPQGFGTDPQTITEADHNQCKELGALVMGVVKMTQEGVPENIIRQTLADSNQLHLNNAIKYAYSLQQFPRHMSDQVAMQSSEAAVMVCFLKKGGVIFKYGEQL